jgi:hypothetical protein
MDGKFLSALYTVEKSIKDNFLRISCRAFTGINLKFDNQIVPEFGYLVKLGYGDFKPLTQNRKIV